MYVKERIGVVCLALADQSIWVVLPSKKIVPAEPIRLLGTFQRYPDASLARIIASRGVCWLLEPSCRTKGKPPLKRSEAHNKAIVHANQVFSLRDIDWWFQWIIRYDHIYHS
jgi:hypothetical protein